VLQLLAEQKMLHSEYGRASLSVLLLQDLAVVPLLALVPLVAAREFMIGVDITFALLEAAVILLLVVTFMLQPFAILWLLVVLVVVKFAILFPLAASFRLGTGVSAAVGLMLAQRLAATSRDVKKASDATPDMAPIVVAGFGRVGRRIGQVLMMADTPYVAIDFSSSVVLRERAAGHRVFYGDVRRPEVLRAVGIADASVVIVTLDDFEAAEDVVAAVHQVDPDITILARGHDSLQCRTLHKLGASLVVSENLEASLELAREALIRSDSDADKVEKMILNFRDSHYATVEGRKPKRQDAGKQ
jgi:voltage-gated potassium channel Kch